MNKYPVFRGVAWIMCVYHLILGIVLNSPVEVIRWTTETFLGATRLPDASSIFLARMLGVYMIVLGIGIGAAAWNPVKNRTLLTLGAILVILRAVQRLIQADDLRNALGISQGSNWIAIAIVLAFAVFMAIFRYRIYREMHSH